MQSLDFPPEWSGKAGVAGLISRDEIKEAIFLFSDFSYTCKLENFIVHDGDGAFPFEMGLREFLLSQWLRS